MSPRQLMVAMGVVLGLVALPGCKRAQPGANATAASVAAPAQSGAAQAARHPGQGAAEAGLEVRVPLVFVDGEPRSAFSYNELPSTLKLGADHHARLCDYFRALGADCAAIRKIDFHAGGHLVPLAGADLRRARSLAFHFSEELAGKPRLDGPIALPGDLEDIMIWVNDKPSGMVRDDGRRGVRINVDGRLVAKIKRNLLEGNVEPIAEPRPGEAPRYRLADFLSSRSLSIGAIRGIDLIARGERVVRLSPTEVAAGIEFTAPDKGHGEMTFLVGATAVKALAIDIWAESAPPTRPTRGPEMHAALGP